jgi:hypothetical protein
LRLPQPGGPGPRIYFPQEQGGTDIPPGSGFPSVASYDSQGYGGGILTSLHTGFGNREILLAAVYKAPGRTWSNADIAELMSLRHKCSFAGDLNVKHPSWNSPVPKSSGEKLLQLFDTNDLEISAPQCPIHYTPGGSGDVLDIVVHKNIRISNIIVSDILDSDHLPITFHILDHVRTQNVSAPLEKCTDL